MDESSKKLGIAILSAVFIFTIGTGFLVADANSGEIDLPIVGTWEFQGSYRYDPETSEWSFDDQFSGSYTRYYADGSFVIFVLGPNGHYFPENLVPNEAGEFITRTGTWLISNGSIEMTDSHVASPDEVNSWTATYSIEDNVMFLEDLGSYGTRGRYIRMD